MIIHDSRLPISQSNSNPSVINKTKVNNTEILSCRTSMWNLCVEPDCDFNQNCSTTCHKGAWVHRRYSSYSFSTLALDEVEWSASRYSHALAPGKGPPVPTVQEAGWSPEPVWTQGLEEKSFCLCWGSNLDRQVVQPTILTELPWL
jgi:hypothetical protein